MYRKRHLLGILTSYGVDAVKRILEAARSKTPVLSTLFAVILCHLVKDKCVDEL
jgi:hypothetical protein